VLRRDAEPPAERAAETRVLAKTLPGALQRCKGLSRAGNVHTCSTGKVLAVSTFQGSEFPRHKKKERSGTGSKTPGEPETLCRKAGGGVLGVLQFPRTGSGHPDSRFHASPRILENWTVSKNRLRPSRIQIPRLAADFGTWTDFKIQISPCRIQITRLAPAIWKLKDKIQIPNSETAVSVYAPALMPHLQCRRIGATGEWCAPVISHSSSVAHLAPNEKAR